MDLEKRACINNQRVALVIVNALEGDARARGPLKCTIHITKPVSENTILVTFMRENFSNVLLAAPTIS